jgi:hypothetical protein
MRTLDPDPEPCTLPATVRGRGRHHGGRHRHWGNLLLVRLDAPGLPHPDPRDDCEPGLARRQRCVPRARNQLFVVSGNTMWRYYD